jgi:hypothetical protein
VTRFELKSVTMQSLKNSHCAILKGMILTVLSTTACTTKRFKDPDEFKEFGRSESSNCTGIDGSSRMSVFYQGDFLFDSDLDWMAEPDGNWRFEWSDRIGRTIGYLTYFRKENVLSHTGLPNTAFPPMTADERGYLVIDGRYAGLKLADLPCILNGKIPERWASRVESATYAGKEQKYVIDDFKSQIELTLYPIEERRNLCFETTWNGIWIFFKQKMLVCRLSSNKQLVEVDYGDYLIQFSALE